MGCMTGNGTVVIFGTFDDQTTPDIQDTTTVVIGAIKSLGALTESGTEVDDTSLSSVYTEKCPGDLLEFAPITMEVNWSGYGTNGTFPFPTKQTPGYMLITFPKPNTDDTAAPTLGMSGFFRETGIDGAANNERIMGSYEFVPDGKTLPPVWTGAVAL